MVTRHKLLNYLHILRTSELNGVALSAVDGIEDLCDFLDIKIMLPTAEIDEAVEANEHSQRNSAAQHKSNTLEARNTKRNHRDDDDEDNYYVSGHSYAKMTSYSQWPVAYERPAFRCLQQLHPSLVDKMEIELANIEMETTAVHFASKSGPYLPPIDPLMVH